MNSVEKLFNYEGNQITFKSQNGTTYVNATEMAKSFGKRPVDYLQNQNTESFLLELSKVRKSTLADLVKVIKGGNNSGTWLHEDVAIEFSRWLSPQFSIWCNDRIKELLKNGLTALPSTIEDILSNPDNGIKLLEALKSERLLKEAANTRLIKQQPIIDYATKVLSTESSYVITQIAQELNLSGTALNKLLANKGVQRKVNGQWILYKCYMDNDFVKSETVPLNNSKSVMQTRWTEKGRAFIHSLVNPVMQALITVKDIQLQNLN